MNPRGHGAAKNALRLRERAEPYPALSLAFRFCWWASGTEVRTVLRCELPRGRDDYGLPRAEGARSSLSRRLSARAVRRCSPARPTARRGGRKHENRACLELNGMG